LESLLLERGLIDSNVVDDLISRYENDVGPMNGARVIAKAWTDPDYRRRLLADGTAAIAELGYSGPQGEHIDVLWMISSARTSRAVIERGGRFSLCSLSGRLL
jgi:nitrile hydratase subunit alpha